MISAKIDSIQPRKTVNLLLLWLGLFISAFLIPQKVMGEFNFHPNTNNYDEINALTLGQSAKLAYAEKDKVISTLLSWGFPRSSAYFFDEGGTQGYIAGNAQMILIAFRGTETTQREDLKTDAKIKLKPGPKGEVHRGFKKGLDKVWDKLLIKLNQFQDREQPIWVTGHSLGGALANLAVARLVLQDNPISVQGLYTYGSPRIGEAEFASEFDDVFLEQYFRFRNNNDVVTRVPVPGLFWLRYRHVGTLKYFDESGQLQDDTSFWDRLFDRISGRLDDLGNPGTDGLKDHSLDRYLELLKKNIDDPS